MIGLDMSIGENNLKGNLNGHLHGWSASSLYRAACILWNTVKKDFDLRSNLEIEETQPTVSSTYMLLIGLCVENLSKGLCVLKEGAFNNEGKFRFTKHNILDLLARANIELSEKENYLIEKLEQFIIWAGKYPGPLEYKDLLPRTLPNGGFAPLNLIESSDHEIAVALIEKLERTLKERANIKI